MQERDIELKTVKRAFKSLPVLLKNAEHKKRIGEMFLSADKTGEVQPLESKPNKAYDFKYVERVHPQDGTTPGHDYEFILVLNGDYALELKPYRAEVDFLTDILPAMALPANGKVGLDIRYTGDKGTVKAIEPTGKVKSRQSKETRDFQDWLLSQYDHVIWFDDNWNIEDVTACAAWWIMKDGRAADDLKTFLIEYAQDTGGDNGDIRLFDGTYKGHLSPGGMKAFLVNQNIKSIKSGNNLFETSSSAFATNNGDDNRDGLQVIESILHNETNPRRPKYSNEWPVTASNLSRQLNVPLRTIYYDIEQGNIDCDKWAQTIDWKEGSALSYRIPVRKHYRFNDEQVEAAKEYYATARKRKAFIDWYAEHRNVKPESARRFIEREEKKNPDLCIEDLTRRIIEGES